MNVQEIEGPTRHKLTMPKRDARSQMSVLLWGLRGSLLARLSL